MPTVQQIIFVLVSIAAIGLFAYKVKQIRRNINLGRDEDLNDNSDKRWTNVMLLAFGQKKMFRNPLVAVMHFVVYAGFIIINIEVLEIV
ncbi:MAG: Fe-S oxidoreductase, partial [Chitinophagaceae bacterium]|nr:Fe-S oxidoreductase [Chitinophagaceae bacterium]